VAPAAVVIDRETVWYSFLWISVATASISPSLGTCEILAEPPQPKIILKLFCLEAWDLLVFIRERELIEYYGVLACVRFDPIEVLNILDANCLGMGNFPKH